MSEVLTLTDGTFDDVVGEGREPVLLDFWASWCGRCRLLDPCVTSVAREYEGRLRVGKVDVESSPALAERFGVLCLPTVLVLDGLEPVARLEGVVTPAALRAAVDRHLGPA